MRWRAQSCVGSLLGHFAHETSSSLLARANCAGQTAVIDSVGVVPERLTQFNTAAQDLNFVRTSCRRVCGHELFIRSRDEVLIVTVPQDSFENVLALAHKLVFQIQSVGMPSPVGTLFKCSTRVVLSLGHGHYSQAIIDVQITESRILCEACRRREPLRRLESIA
jgi:hypothetical protein